MIRVAPLRYGVIFKKAFSQPHIFTAFVKDFTGMDIEIDKVETEKSFSPAIGRVDSRFDLFAEDKNRIIVDIQHKRLSDHYDRFLHYHCAALLEQVANSYSYTTNMRVFTIVILTSGDKHKTDIAITDFEPKDRDGNGIGETQHKIIYACPKYVSDKTPSPYREWLNAINDSLDGKIDENHYHNQFIRDIFGLIEEDKTTPQEYARMKDEYVNEEYIRDKRAEAEKKGVAIGLEQGMEKGMEKGIKLAKQENAKAMLQEGIDKALIAKITGLSEQEVEQLVN